MFARSLDAEILFACPSSPPASAVRKNWCRRNRFDRDDCCHRFKAFLSRARDEYGRKAMLPWSRGAEILPACLSAPSATAVRKDCCRRYRFDRDDMLPSL